MATKPKTSRLSSAGLARCGFFFLLFWSGIVLAFDGFIAWNVFRQIRALAYPTTMGLVTCSELVQQVSKEHWPTYFVKIRYWYFVAGKDYEGTRYRYVSWSSSSGAGQRFVDSYPVLAHVEVHYAPADPSDAVLAPGLDAKDLLLAMLALPFNLAMLALWIVIGGGVRGRSLPSSALERQISDDGRFVRVRLSLWSPLCSAAAVAGGLAFVLIFLVRFVFWEDPTLTTMLVLWGVILGGGSLAYILSWWKPAQGGSELLIDDFRRTITLPRMFGREEELAVPAEKIVSIEVEQEAKPTSRGGSSLLYVPTLVFTDRDGSPRREKLVEWQIEEKAERLASWLRKRLHIKPLDDFSSAR